MTYISQGASPTRRSPHPRRARLVLAPLPIALLALAAPSVTRGAPVALTGVPAIATEATVGVRPELPRVELGALPGPARRHAEELRHSLAAGLADPARSDVELAGGFALLGQLYLAHDLPAAAEQAFDAALELAPGDVDLLHRRGLARREAGSHAGAVADFREVVAGDPERLAAWLYLGDALLAAGSPAEARAAYAAAEALGARAAAAYGLGRAALAAGEPATAIEHFQAALALQPSASVAHGDLARAYAAHGDPERARSHRLRAGEGAFAFPDPVADQLLRLRAFTAFEAVRERAADPRPGFDEESFLDLVLGELGSVPGALDRLRAALAEVGQAAAAAGAADGSPEVARLHLAIGGLLLAQGRRDEGIGELEAAVTVAPELDHARLQLAGALAQQERFDEALVHYDRLLAEDPDDAVTLTRRGASRLRLGRRAEARRDLERAVSVAVDRATEATARTLLAGLAVDEGRLDEAAELYRLALESDPQSSDALRGQGLLFGRSGRYRDSAAAFRRLLELEPADAAARDAEVVSLILAGDEVAALARLEEAVAELPDDPRFAGRLARLLAAASIPSLRDGERAVELALEVFAVEPTAETVETLAMAYAEAGEHEEAVVWQRRLLAAEGAAAQDQERRRRNLALYESGRSCCAAAPTSRSGENR